MISSAPDTEIVEHKAKVYDYQEMLNRFNILSPRAGQDPIF